MRYKEKGKKNLADLIKRTQSRGMERRGEDTPQDNTTRIAIPRYEEGHQEDLVVDLVDQ
jgi:hypothetical protein